MATVFNYCMCLQGLTALHMAAHQGHGVMVSQLCRVPRVEVDALDNTGCTPLHHATALGHDSVVMELWSKSANVDLADANGWTGLPSVRSICSQSRSFFYLSTVGMRTLLCMLGRRKTHTPFCLVSLTHGTSLMSATHAVCLLNLCCFYSTPGMGALVSTTRNSPLLKL